MKYATFMLIIADALLIVAVFASPLGIIPVVGLNFMLYLLLGAIFFMLRAIFYQNRASYRKK